MSFYSKIKIDQIPKSVEGPKVFCKCAISGINLIGSARGKRKVSNLRHKYGAEVWDKHVFFNLAKVTLRFPELN